LITDTKSCNINSETHQPIRESSEETQNDSIETSVEPTSVDRETNEQEPNVSDIPSPAEPCFDSEGNSVDKKPSTRQRQAIVAGIVGIALLVSSVVFYILKMYVIAVIGGIVGLACMSFALYNVLKPNTKVENVEPITDLNFEANIFTTINNK